jgi:glucose/arabinose dehydrogenase
MRTRRTATVAAGALLLALTGCSSASTPEESPSPTPSATSPSPTTSESPSPTPSPTSAALAKLKVSGVVARDLDVPWGFAFLPDGDALVAERDSGRILRVTSDGDVRSLGTVPGVRHGGEGGLLGLAVDPASTDRVYAYFTSDHGDNRIVRMTYAGGLGTPHVILTGIPSGSIHNGGRMVFGPDGFLYVGTGEAGLRSPAQDRGSLGGKILRITPSGDVPADNPFKGSPVWSYGHRNVQGLAFDSRGRLWATEFGQDTWDELNLIRKGRNYGWPVVEGKADRAGYVDPLVTWHPSQASPSGLAIVDDVAYLATLRGNRLWQVRLTGEDRGTRKAWFTGDYGRLRTVVLAPDGSLWLTTSNRDGRGNPAAHDDRILQVRLT